MSSFDVDPYGIGSYSPANSPAAYVPAGPSAGSSSPSANITVAPGYTPDYSALLASDPTLAAANNTAQANQQTGDAARRAAVQSQYVQYGGDLPSGWTDKYGDIDQATKDAASGNQFSTIANLKSNYNKSVDAFKKGLAARGALQSSELTYGQDQEDRGLAQQEYDAGNAFLGNVSGDYGAYAGVLGQNARDLAAAAGTAQGNVLNNPANRPVAPTVAHYDTSNSAKYGKPVYTDAWGTLYDQFGNVLVAGTPPPTPPPPTSSGYALNAAGYAPNTTAADLGYTPTPITSAQVAPPDLSPLARTVTAPTAPSYNALAPIPAARSGPASQVVSALANALRSGAVPTTPPGYGSAAQRRRQAL